MKRVLSIIGTVLLSLFLAVGLTGCMTEADKVSYNVSKEADNFNVMRRLVVINSRSDKIILQMVGKLSIKVDAVEKQLEVVSEMPNDAGYQKHFVNMNEWTTYTLEDVSGVSVSKYGYEMEFMPESIIPVRITNKE